MGTTGGSGLVRPRLCAAYRKKLETLPQFLPEGELDAIVDSLFSSSYHLALQELEGVATRTDMLLHKDKRKRVGKLLSKAGEAERILPRERGEPAGRYRMRVVRPGGPPKRLTHDLERVGLCWTGEQQAQRLQQDIDAGACLLVLGESEKRHLFDRLLGKKGYVPVMMMRSYVTLSQKGAPVLFLDTIESGRTEWDSIRDWTEGGREREFLHAIAAALWTARQYAIPRVAMGEREAQELAALLGFTEERLYLPQDKTQSMTGLDYRRTRKIGYPGNHDGHDGPYVYQLFDGTEKRVIHVDAVLTRPQGIAEKVDTIERFLGQSPKAVKHKPKAQELGWYLRCLDALAARNGEPRARERIADLRRRLPE